MSDDMPAPRPDDAAATPISDALDRHLTETLNKIPSTGRGRLALDLSLDGWRGEAVHRISPVWSAGAYVAGGWNRAKPEAGARLQATW